MIRNRIIAIAKIGIIPVILSLAAWSCRYGNRPGEVTEVFRFDRMLFSVPADRAADSIRIHHPDIMPFFRAFNEGIIRIGPDSLAGYPEQLSSFTGDTMIRRVYDEIVKNDIRFLEQFALVFSALENLEELTGKPVPRLVTYISGFNRSFTALPGILGLGLDNYLGSDFGFYDNLGIPVYQQDYMNPENLAPDAARAWVISETTGPDPGSSFLDHLVYHGKVLYLVRKLMPDIPEKLIFRFSEDQLDWCRSHEPDMWKYLAGQRIIFSTDRFTIRKFMEEAPFTKDFGNESPGRAATWIGYRIVSQYVKKNKPEPAFFFSHTDSREILAASGYRP